MNEKLIERKLTQGAKRRGGIALKFFSPWFTGMPDRIVLVPIGKFRFAEVKTTDKPLSRKQKVVHAFLDKLGFPVSVIDSQETLDAFFNELDS